MNYYTDDLLLVNHHDACIYGRDLKLLEDPTAWLNDACLHYHFVCLQEQFPAVLFLDPSVVFCLVCLEKDEFESFLLGYPQLKTTRKVLLPINDSLAGNPSSGVLLGTHWSLLLIVLSEDNSNNNNKSSSSYIHFDSMMNGGNAKAAQVVADQWNALWGSSTTTTTTQPRVQQAKTPQQTNGYDCGLYVLLTAQVLATTDVEELQDRLKEALNPRQCRELRNRIAADIRQRAKVFQESK